MAPAAARGVPVGGAVIASGGATRRPVADAGTVGAPTWARAAAVDLALASAAAAALAASGRPWGPWWAAVVAGGLLWPVLARAPAARGALLAGVALSPVPAVGYEGLRVFDPAAWWAVTVGVAAAYGLVGAAAAALGARAWPRAPLAWRPLPWALAWAGLDLLLTHARPWPLPFPVTPGYALVGGPAVPLAALGGPVALGAAWAVFGVAAAGFGRGRLGLPGARAWWPPASMLALACVALQVAAERTATGEPRTLAIAQRPAADGARLAAFARGAAGVGADLHVWPEAALQRELADDATALWAVARDLGAPVLAGAFRRAEDGGWRNAAAIADRHGVVFAVDKRWLVPGYEAWLGPGTGERWPVRAAGWRLGVLVCWESLFLDEAIERVRRGADLVVVLAHDGWAEGTATPWWHARAGRLVAWSVGRPVAVASHDGPSMVWGHDGRQVARAGADATLLRSAVAAPLAWRTPYVTLGPAGLARAWLVAVAITVASTVATASAASRRSARRARQGCGASGPQAA